MPPADSLSHLTEFLLLLGAFVIQGPGYVRIDPVQDKAKALTLFAKKGDASEYKKVLASIRQKKKFDENRLEKSRQSEKRLEAGIRNDQAMLANPGNDARSILSRIKDRKETLKTCKDMISVRQKIIAGWGKQEQAFIKAHRLIEQERKRAGGRQTLLLHFFLQFDAFIGPDIDARCPWPISLPDKAKALLLFAKKGDDTEHKKILAAIRKKKKEAEALIGKHRGFVKEIQDDLRADQALLVKAAGDTSGIEKRIAGHKRRLEFQTECVAALCPHVQARAKEEKAWVEALRLIDKGRAAQKKP